MFHEKKNTHRLGVPRLKWKRPNELMLRFGELQTPRRLAPRRGPQARAGGNFLLGRFEVSLGDSRFTHWCPSSKLAYNSYIYTYEIFSLEY